MVSVRGSMLGLVRRSMNVCNVFYVYCVSARGSMMGSVKGSVRGSMVGSVSASMVGSLRGSMYVCCVCYFQ